MKPSERIVDLFGGIHAMARSLGHKYPSTVQGWRERGYIPARRMDEVLRAAVRMGIDLTPADFLEQPGPFVGRGAASDDPKEAA